MALGCKSAVAGHGLLMYCRWWPAACAWQGAFRCMCGFVCVERGRKEQHVTCVACLRAKQAQSLDAACALCPPTLVPCVHPPWCPVSTHLGGCPRCSRSMSGRSRMHVPACKFTQALVHTH